MNASRTSSPTSKHVGPIDGPSHAIVAPGTRPLAAMVVSITPAASPRQPAWAAATHVPSRFVNRIGMQSATSTAQTRPGVAVNDASACTATPVSSGSASSPPTRTTRTPCT